MAEYDPRAWYWIVGGNETRRWSSAASAYVPDDDAAYAAFLDRGSLPSRIASEAELWEVLRQVAPDRLPSIIAGEPPSIFSDPLILDILKGA